MSWAGTRIIRTKGSPVVTLANQYSRKTTVTSAGVKVSFQLGKKEVQF